MHISEVFVSVSLAAMVAQALSIKAVPVHLDVSSISGNSTSPYQYGLMFEDINHSGDGGIYAELIQNRAFQALNYESATTDPWFTIGGSVLKLNQDNWLSQALQFSVNVVAPDNATGNIGLGNPGWWGIPISPQVYTGSFYISGAYNGNVTISLASQLTSDVFATKSIPVKSKTGKWKLIKYTLIPSVSAPTSNNTLSVTFNPTLATDGSLNFNMISLFPETYANRPNGMRKDLMEALNGISPSFFRMPGGNNIEGSPGVDQSLGVLQNSSRWIWNETIGPLIDRPGRMGTWGYYNTDGLGLAEYLDWCIDLDMEPVLAVWDGHYLDGTSVAQNALQPYIDDVLNELEYILGDATTKYGALRISHGHVKPWKVNYVEIGNEDNITDGLDSYAAYRWIMFFNAIKAAYPHITPIASTVSVSLPAGSMGDYHQYTRPDDFVSQSDWFDNYPINTPTMIGEYGCVQNNIPGGGGPNWSLPLNSAPHWEGSVAEAVFLLGAERNSAAVFGAAYAPTLENYNSYLWATNMISFQADPSLTVLSTSWHVSNLLSGTRFTETRAVTGSIDLTTGPLYVAAGANLAIGSMILKAAVYNSSAGNSLPMSITFPGIKAGTLANLTVLTTAGPFEHASTGYNPVMSTITTLFAAKGGVFTFGLPNLSVALLATEPKSGSTVGSLNGWKGFGGYGGCKGGKARGTTGNGC